MIWNGGVGGGGGGGGAKRGGCFQVQSKEAMPFKYTMVTIF